MNKQAFLDRLRRGLAGLPQDDMEERIAFYSEMIDDRIEEGFSEEEAVNGIGSVDAIISQIIADVPLTKLVRTKITPKDKLNPWATVLLILGSPLWLSLLIAAFAVILSVYVSLWAVIVSLWAVFGSVAACAFGGIVCGSVFASGGNHLPGIAMIGGGIICAGLSIFLFFGCKIMSTNTLLLSKKITLGIKNRFLK